MATSELMSPSPRVALPALTDSRVWQLHSSPRNLIAERWACLSLSTGGRAPRVADVGAGGTLGCREGLTVKAPFALDFFFLLFVAGGACVCLPPLAGLALNDTFLPPTVLDELHPTVGSLNRLSAHLREVLVISTWVLSGCASPTSRWIPRTLLQQTRR